MSLIKQCGLLVVGLATTGCGQENSVDVVPASPTVTISSPVPQQRTPGGENLFAERVLGGSRVDPLADPKAKAVVLIFVSTDCPIANRYAPELRRLYEAYQARGVSFWLVYAAPDETPEKIRRHIAEYHHPMPALRDPDHRLVKFCEASRTPEAAVFAPGRNRMYRGRIDDRFTDYGKSREFASQHDLQDAIEAVLAGRTVKTPATEAIGCHIPGFEE